MQVIGRQVIGRCGRPRDNSVLGIWPLLKTGDRRIRRPHPMQRGNAAKTEWKTVFFANIICSIAVFMTTGVSIQLLYVEQSLAVSPASMTLIGVQQFHLLTRAPLLLQIFHHRVGRGVV